MGSITGIPSQSGVDVNAVVEALSSAERARKTEVIDRREKVLEAERRHLLDTYTAIQGLSQTIRSLMSTLRFTPVTAEVSHPDMLSVEPALFAKPGKFQIIIEKLASSHKLVSGKWKSNSRATLKGELEITTGRQQWTFALSGRGGFGNLAQSIEATTNSQIKATVIHSVDEEQLLLSSNSFGVGSSMTLSGTGDGDALARSFTQLSSAQDALVVIEGVEANLPGNEHQSPFDGFYLDLKQANPNQTIVVEAAENANELAERLIEFVNDCNALFAACDPRDEEGVRSSSSAYTHTSVRNFGYQLKHILAGHNEKTTEPIRCLADIGISMQKDGRIGIDSMTLYQQLSLNLPVIKSFLLSDNSPIVAARKLLDSVHEKDSPFQDRASVLSRQMEQLSRQRERVEEELQKYEMKTAMEFSQMEKSIFQSRQLSQRIASLTVPDKR